MPKKSTFNRNLESIIASETAGKFAQQRLDNEFVKVAIRETRTSIIERMATLFKGGKPATVQDAINHLANNSVKGTAFEAILASRHEGASPFNWSIFSTKNGGISQNDSQIDVKAYTKNLFTGKESAEAVQAKCSFEGAANGIRQELYENPIVVPKDVFDDLANSKNEKIADAIRSGKLKASLGDSGEVHSKEAIQLAKKRLNEIFDGNAEPEFYKILAKEVGAAFTVGAAVRGGLSAITILIKEKKISAKHAKTIAKDGAIGGLQTASRVGIARGLGKVALSKGIANHGGAWLERSAGAVAGLILNTAVDGFYVFHSKKDKRIAPREFGIRFTKNSVVAIATCISGPIGLGVSLTITAGEFIHGEQTKNNEISKQALNECRLMERKMNRDLKLIEGSLQDQESAIKRVRQIAYETKLLLKGSRNNE